MPRDGAPLGLVVLVGGGKLGDVVIFELMRLLGFRFQVVIKGVDAVRFQGALDGAARGLYLGDRARGLIQDDVWVWHQAIVFWRCRVSWGGMEDEDLRLTPSGVQGVLTLG